MASTEVKKLEPEGNNRLGWYGRAIPDGRVITYRAKKIMVTSGAYVNHILRPSFGIQLRLDIWEMVASCSSAKGGTGKNPDPSECTFSRNIAKWGLLQKRHVVSVPMGCERLLEAF
jgi:hypothetical protein